AAGLLDLGEFSSPCSRSDMSGQIFRWELRDVGIKTQIPLSSELDGWHLH
ncbi:uncharacterized, partial [Tachysurus ichikawai]